MQFHKAILPAIFFVTVCAFQAIAQQGDIDWNRARQLRQRSLRGDKLTEEDQSYLQRAIELRQQQKAPQRRPVQVKPPVGLKPLTDMTGDDRYKGQDGGVGQASSDRPRQHRRVSQTRRGNEGPRGHHPERAQGTLPQPADRLPVQPDLRRIRQVHSEPGAVCLRVRLRGPLADPGSDQR